MSAAPPTFHVAVGVITDTAGSVLITRRPDHTHQGGFWEFPGGKVEADETVEIALQRELWEELGIAIQSAEPLLQIHHTYSDRNVLLDVWRVTAYSGEPQGREGQPVVWVLPTLLGDFAFPAADTPIIQRLLRQE